MLKVARPALDVRPDLLTVPTFTTACDGLGRLTRQVVSGTVDDVQASQTTTYRHAGATRTMNRRGVSAGVDILQTTKVDGRGRTVWAEYATPGAPAGDIRSRATVYGTDGGVGLVSERLTGGEPDRAYAYSYDGAGRLLSAVEAGQQVDYSYLALGGGAVGVAVDPVMPDDVPFERHFDLLGRLVSVDAAGGSIGLSWNDNGTLAGIDGQGLSESWSYYGGGLLPDTLGV